jgi:hypothetical protein
MLRFPIEIVFGLVLVTSVAFVSSLEIIVLAARTDPAAIRKLELHFLLGL